MDITSIAALVNQDLLRPNKFRVQIAGAPDLVNKLCSDATFPGLTYNAFMWRNAGPAIKLPLEPVFDECTLQFYCDSAGTVPAWIRKWSRDVMSEEWDMNFFDQYVKDVDIWEINQQGQDVNHVKLINAYPLVVGGTQLSFENMNAVQKISCTLTYEYTQQQ